VVLKIGFNCAFVNESFSVRIRIRDEILAEWLFNVWEFRGALCLIGAEQWFTVGGRSLFDCV
jgi:hypothetical protein